MFGRNHQDLRCLAIKIFQNHFMLLIKSLFKPYNFCSFLQNYHNILSLYMQKLNHLKYFIKQ
jgi:hypothetical protein